MERRKFISNLGIVGLGMTITNELYASIIPKLVHSQVIMPTSSAQIRHGVYEINKRRTTGFPKWFKVFETHRFSANGVDLGSNDLVIFYFNIYDQPYSLQVLEKSVFLTHESGLLDLRVLSNQKIKKDGYEFTTHFEGEFIAKQGKVLIKMPLDINSNTDPSCKLKLTHYRYDDHIQDEKNEIVIEIGLT